MLEIVAVLVLVALVVKSRRRKPRKQVRLLYAAPPRIVESEAIFQCGCRYNLTDPERRAICRAHQAIIAAEVEA